MRLRGGRCQPPHTHTLAVLLTPAYCVQLNSPGGWVSLQVADCKRSGGGSHIQGHMLHMFWMESSTAPPLR